MFDKIKNSVRLCELFLHIHPEKFHTLKFILEGYDNLALLSSVAQKPGLVRIRYPVELSKELFLLLSAVAKDLQS